MKRNFVLMSFVLCSAFISQAQIKKGAILLGGNVGFATQTNSPTNQGGSFISKQTSVSVSPIFGKAVKENLVVGADITADYSKNTYSSGYNTQKSITTGAGVFIRKYKYLGNNFYLFGQGRLGANYISQEYTYLQASTLVKSEIKGYAISAGFYPGISYAINNRLQLETGFNNLVYINYSHTKATNQYNGPSEYKSNSFSLGSSLSSFSSFTVGVRFLLNKQG